MRSEQDFGNSDYLRRVDFFLSAVFGLVFFVALGALDEVVAWPDDCAFAAAEPLRRCEVEACCATTGSATRMRVPAATLVPVNLFQRRN